MILICPNEIHLNTHNNKNMCPWISFWSIFMWIYHIVDVAPAAACVYIFIWGGKWNKILKDWIEHLKLIAFARADFFCYYLFSIAYHQINCSIV